MLESRADRYLCRNTCALVEAIQVSIVMPVHNCAPFLAEALDSLLNQRDLTLELIAVNDGSTDDSLAVLRAAARDDSRITIIDQSNQGPAVARNAGLHAARGDWVAFADADDWLAPGALAGWHRHACAQNLDVLIGNGYRFDDDPRVPVGRPLLKRQPWGEVMSGAAWIVRCTEQDEWPHYVWLQFIRRRLIQQHRLRFAAALLHEDILWTLDVALAARRMGFAEPPAYGYRNNPASIVNSPSQASIARRAHSYIHILRALVESSASSRGNPALRRALLRHANVECAYFDQLLRKKLRGGALRREVARSFHETRLWRALWRGAAGMRQYRRLARCYMAVMRFRR